jgi:hypothetical protein
MSKGNIKTWLVLLALLALTLVLVWQAPELEQTDIVEASKVTAEQEATTVILTEPVSADSLLVLNPRQYEQNTVDLFSSPAKPQLTPAPVVKRPIEITPQQRVELPFRYVGMFRSGTATTLFVMEGPKLFLVQEGDVVSQHFRLQRIDIVKNQLVWLHLPSNETHKMSMDQ